MVVNRLLRRLKITPPLVVFATAIVIFFITVVILYQASPKHPTIDWLTGQDWSHMAGAEQTNTGVHFKALGRAINHKDTSDAQQNPPVNIRGRNLQVAGDFRIEMAFSGADNGVIAQFYGQVPVIYDEWRQERGSIRIQLTADELSVKIWDGTAGSAIDQRTYKNHTNNDAKIILTNKADKIWIQLNNDILGYIPSHGIFSEGAVWFGADAGIGTSGWTLTSLKAKSIGEGLVSLDEAINLALTDVQSDSLRALAAANPRNLPIGAAVSVYPLFSDTDYAKIAMNEFSMLTPENSMKPQTIHPQKEVYAFEDADSVVEAAQKNQMLVHGHALVLGKANPEWMQKTALNERKQTMVSHITTVVNHFKGQVAEWDVVNEPLSEDDIDYLGTQQGIRKQMWFDAMGESYIDTAFIAAHNADPSTKLYLNDYGLEKEGKRWDAMLSLVQRLKARSVPIYGVGFESHVYHSPADTIDSSVLKQHIQLLAQLGVASRISEIDVLGDDEIFQANQYTSVLQACLSEPTCMSFGVWGISDLYGSTTISDRYPIKLGDSLIWNYDYSAKPAYSSLQSILKQ